MDIPGIAPADTGSRKVRPVAADTEHLLQPALVAAEVAGWAMAVLPRPATALRVRQRPARLQAGCCRRPMAQRAALARWTAYRVGLPADKPARQDLRTANRSAKPATSDRQPARANSRRRCSLRFPDNNLRDAACRTRCRKLCPDPSHRTAFGNRDKQVRSLVPEPLTEMKRIPADLDQVAALQRAHADRLAGNKDRSG